ncbi:MAG: zinc dependent phospholipase C family protein [Oscillospiraceae bacterium]|nr:zinc dependent phospholipase C family protein [Oscillospiraceae bacterium]
MAFTMTHLIISKNISESFAGQIEDLPQFYLGSIAPDAVHNRANYISEHKKASHLISGTEKWGFTTENEAWKNNVVAFLDKNKKSENRDFILGYCCHVLSDIYNNINVWTPFRQKYAEELEKGYGNIHHQENNKIDIELALTYEGRNEFWLHLANSKSIDLPPLIYAAELDRQKDNILRFWYRGKERQDISSNRIRTYGGEMEFIANATDFVANVFRETH